MFDKDNRLTVANRHYVEMYRFPKSVSGRAARCGNAEARTAAGTFGGSIEQYISRQIVQEAQDRRDSGRPHRHHRELLDAGRRWVSTHQDVTEQRRSEERIAHMARHDALTGSTQSAAVPRADGAGAGAREP